MPRLNNSRHELFAQAVAEGTVSAQAYIAAGFKAATLHTAEVGAHRLMKNPEIRQRIGELQKTGEEEAASSVSRTIQEMARIAYSDIRNAVNWSGAVVKEETKTTEDGDVTEYTLRAENQVVVVDSKRLDAATAAAIQEVSQTKDGAIRVKMHAKMPALNALLEHHKAVDDLLQSMRQNEPPKTEGNVITPDFAAARRKYGGG
jgi:phage terminase small subunit